MLRHLLIAALAAAPWVTAAAGPAREKVILDTDFTTTGDDGMVGIMAAQLHAQGVIELLGITVVAGNEWLPQEVAEALRAVERLGIADSVGVSLAEGEDRPAFRQRPVLQAICRFDDAAGTSSAAEVNSVDTSSESCRVRHLTWPDSADASLVLVPRHLAAFGLVPFVPAQLAVQVDDVAGGQQEPYERVAALLAVLVRDDGLVIRRRGAHGAQLAGARHWQATTK